jgi:hypothetical protein
LEAAATEVVEATMVAMHNVVDIGGDDEELAMAAALDATLAHDPKEYRFPHSWARANGFWCP